MTRICALDVVDVRFPTSRWLDGSDAMNPEPDYSAAYLLLRTDDPDVTGYSLLFTTGRGNDVACAAVRALAPYVLGRDVSELVADIGSLARTMTWDGQLRWLGPEKGVMHMAIGAVVNAAWDLRSRVEGAPLWKILCGLSAEEIVRQIDFTYIQDAMEPAEALALLEAKAAGRTARISMLEREGLAAYTTSAGWLGYDDAKVERLVRASVADGFTMLKLKVGADVESDVRRLRAARAAAGKGARIALDANQRWGIGEAIEWMGRLAEFDPYWIEEPTSPDDVLGHRTIREGVRPIRVATGEHVQNRVIFKQLLQAEAIDVVQIDACRVGGVNENLAILLLAAQFDVPVCPHAGGVGLCEMVQHLAMFDYVAVSGTTEGRWIEYVDHLHEHFTDPVVLDGGRYRAPTAPGAGAAPRRLDRAVPVPGRASLGDGELVTARVDSHHHLWDLAARPQPWLAPDAMAPIRRSFGVADLLADASGTGLDATVVVQTVPEVAETEELLDLAAATPLILGVVGFVDLEARDVGEELDRLRSRPSGGWLVGIRNPVQDEPDPDWLVRTRVIAGLRAVAERGLVYDLLIRPHHLGAALRAVTAVGDGRFVIDHLAKPEIASGDGGPWAAGMAALALRENVAAKLSGLVTEASWQSWALDDLRPYADHALSCFGSDRLLFGSDWPVCRLAATYAQVVDTAEALTGPLNASERDDVMGDTAVAMYGLRMRSTGGTE